METSRDDFIIGIRSAFLKKGTQQKFSLLTLIVFSILFLLFEGVKFKPINYLKIAIQEIAYRSTLIVSKPQNFIKDSYQIIQNHTNLYKENTKKNLEIEVTRSKDISRNIIEYENIRLKQIINDYLDVGEEIFAKTLIDKKSPFLRSIIINKGSRNAIELGMAVVADSYFVGKVVDVNYMTSRVLLISDINSKIPVTIEPNNIQAIMSGDSNRGGLIEYVDENNLEYENATVFTSGMGGILKSGMPIGIINKKKVSLNKELTVNFYKDLSQIKYVKVLSFKENNFKSKQVQDNRNNKDNKNDENFILLKREREISDEIKLQLKNENSLLNNQISKLKREKLKLKKIGEGLKSRISDDELEFLRLNLLYGHKCRKNLINKLYKINTIEYRNCVMKRKKD
ncbi:rod shape-determining protein MreC [Candidatus Pelagibacter sp.]|nr:rod shape-determining protein MreC [Candidatus Pelagibacter sp.]